MSLRQIRAIPHNAILQQLGYPVNVIAGLGSAADGNYEELAALLQESERGRQLVRLARSSNALASIKRSEEHTSELQSLMRISYAVFCLIKKNQTSNSLSLLSINSFYFTFFLFF